LRRSKSFKVIDVGISRKPVCDCLLVINSKRHHLVPFRSNRSLLFKFWTLCLRNWARSWLLGDNVRYFQNSHSRLMT